MNRRERLCLLPSTLKLLQGAFVDAYTSGWTPGQRRFESPSVYQHLVIVFAKAQLPACPALCFGTGTAAQDAHKGQHGLRMPSHFGFSDEMNTPHSQARVTSVDGLAERIVHEISPRAARFQQNPGKRLRSCRMVSR